MLVNITMIFFFFVFIVEWQVSISKQLSVNHSNILVYHEIVNYSGIFYNISKLFNYGSNYTFISNVHLLRIPKASSSSFSAVARRYHI